MNLEELGYNSNLEKYREEQNLSSFGVGRICLVHKERYIVKTPEGDFEGEIIGNLRFSAQSSSDFPAVGDWVAISDYDEDKVLIHSVYPRSTILERQAVGKHGEKQIIAANIDYAFIVQSVDRDFNINRVERFLTICNASKVKPIILLNKIDLISIDHLEELQEKMLTRIKNTPSIAISNQTHNGYEELNALMGKGQTFCLLGSSGVGKSTLLNNLSGKALMETGAISESTNKGKHVTSHRELVVLENGSVLIDNPGIREVGIADSTDGLESTFNAIVELSYKCKFKDCSHRHESGCAILEAVEKGEIDKASLDNYLKLEKEKSHFESTVVEKRQKDKDFGKMVKTYKNMKRRSKE